MSTKPAQGGGSIFQRLSDPSMYTGTAKLSSKDGKAPAKVEKKSKAKQDAPNELTTKIGELRGHATVVFRVIVTTDDDVVTASLDHTIRAWDMESQKESVILADHKGSVRALAQLGSTLLSAAEDKTIRMFDLRESKCHKTIAVDSPAMSMVVDGDVFYTGHEDGTIRRWDINMPDKATHVAKKHTGSVLALFQNKDGLYSGSRDRMIHLWDTTDVLPVKSFVHHHDSITSLTQWKDCIVSASRDKQIKEYVFDDSGKDIGKTLVAAHSDWVTVILPSADGNYLLSGSKDTTIKVWNKDWSLAAHVLEHDGMVHDLAWYKGLLLSASHDATVMVHELRSSA